MTATTFHSIDRAKDRCNLKNYKTAKRNIHNAMQRGKRAEDCTSWERDYLSTEAHGDCFAIAYNNFCYIFNDSNVCVTIYDLPAWFGKRKHFDGKERIRDYKKYCKSNQTFLEQ